ncbi:MAG: hypothetical protein HUU11_16975 [Anaerolineales bacterium]|nr:hypothetical protein [Anaerolineales bacterium]NUQ86400.1 hypothetical protein [Anaerolineales bacterium]
MKTKFGLLISFALLSILLMGCVAEIAASAPTPTPTPTKQIKPTFTPTATKPPEVPPTETPTPPPLPSTFDMMMSLVNGTCGGGATYSYTFNIEGTTLDLVQTDAGITTSGTYDPLTGAFSTSADVGPGSETYDGVISYDGTTITVTGSYAWVPDSGVGCTAEITGTTTP